MRAALGVNWQSDATRADCCRDMHAFARLPCMSAPARTILDLTAVMIEPDSEKLLRNASRPAPEE